MFEHHNLDAAVNRLQRRVVFLLRRALVLDICLGGTIVAFLATVFVRLGGWPVSLLMLVGAVLLLTGLVCLLLAWRVKASAPAVLQCADRVQRFQERLSTAFEYLQTDVRHPFVASLVAEAERIAPQANPRQVFPGRCPRRVWVVPLLLMVILGVSRFDIAPLHFQDLDQEEVKQEVAHEGERLERWGRRLEELATQQRLDRSLILARHMQNLGRRLQHEGGAASEVAKRISTLSQYLERMQQELQERSLMTDVGSMLTRDVLMSGKSVKQELQDILRLLQNDALPREMAAVAEQGIHRLSQYLGKNPTLEQMMQSLRAGNVEAARRLLQDIIQRQQVAEEMEHLERAKRALEYSSRSIQKGEGGRDESVTHSANTGGDRMAGEAPFDYDEEMLSEDMPTMEDFAAPGLDQGFGTARHNRAGLQRDLRESEQSASEVEVKSGEGDMRLAYIRHLPVQNEARVPFDEVVGQYERAAEEVLSREKVPRAYREQVKQYFLAIGMMPESKP